MSKLKLAVITGTFSFPMVGFSSSAFAAADTVVITSGWSGTEDPKSYAGPGPGTSQPHCAIRKTLSDGTDFRVDLWLGAKVAKYSFLNTKWRALDALPSVKGKFHAELQLTLVTSENVKRLTRADVWQSTRYSPPGFHFEEGLKDGATWLNGLRGTRAVTVERDGQAITTIDMQGYPNAITFLAKCINRFTYDPKADPFTAK